MNKSLTPTAHGELHLPGQLQKWQQMHLLSNLETISHSLWERPHLEGSWMWLGPNHWNQPVELHLLLQSVVTITSDVPCSLRPHFMCFKLWDSHPSAAHSPTELSVGGLPWPSMREQGKSEYPRDSAAVLNSASSSSIFTFSLPSACPSAAPGVRRCPQGRSSLTCWYNHHLFLRFLTQGKSCGLERVRCYPLVTAEQVILLKPGACCHFPGWKLPWQGAGADVAFVSAGETPSSRQAASQPNQDASWT